MIQQAAQDHGIDLKRSFCIGDSLRDVERVGELGVRGILVTQEVSGSHPGLVLVPSFEAAVRVVFLS
jgi:histidinol phosphatase-like enzyme